MKKYILMLIVSAMYGDTFFQTVSAASHREASNITRMPTADSTDFYAFNSYEAGRGDYVTLIANYIPLQGYYGGAHYFTMDPAATYDIHIDNDGDAVEDITFSFNFSQMISNNNASVALIVGADGAQKSISVPLRRAGGISTAYQSTDNFFESYTVKMISGPVRTGTSADVTNSTSGSTSFNKPLDYIGNKTFTNAEQYTAYANSHIYSAAIPGCAAPAKVFVGQRKDAFTVNLGKVFDLVNLVPIEGDSTPSAGDKRGFPSSITQSAANDNLTDKNVTSIAIEVPTACLIGSGNGVIGSWTTTSLPQTMNLNPNDKFINTEANGGAMAQVSRLGSPLISELVIGLADKDKFSSSHPSVDGWFADYVTQPTLPELINILFKNAVNTSLNSNFPTLSPTNFPRVDLVTAFLTGFPGLNQLSMVTAAEMLRLNTGIAAVSADMQSSFGMIGDDLAGFPNGRRPGDDVVDIIFRVAMGRLCYPIPISGTDTDLGLCVPEDASVGNVAFTDGSPSNAAMIGTSFPYLVTPLPSSE